MRILIVTPASAGSRQGNRVTALRWARILRELGHRVTLATGYGGGGDWDLLVALHARRSAPSAARFARERPGAPLIVAMTGTDLYRDLPRNGPARVALARAARIVVLQPRGLAALPPAARRKARVILQSARPAAGPRGRRPASLPSPVPELALRSRETGRGAKRRSRASAARPQASPIPFDVCVLGHLRPVKDPFRAAMASRLLPASSRIRVLQVGAALSPSMARRARAEAARNPRYRWLGERSPAGARRLLASSRLLVLTSRLEGGANVVAEAIVVGVPVVSSRIEGSVGQLGQGYPGYFPPGDTSALARLLRRCESDATFRSRLARWCARLAPHFHPARERRAWRALLGELRPLSTFSR